MKGKCIIRCLLLIVLSANVFNAGAEVYKWIDAQGNTHYGERPPTAGSADSVTIRKGPSAPDPVLDRYRDRQQKYLDVLQQEREEKKEQDKKKEQENKQLQRRCLRARDRLRSYQSAGGIYEIDKQGNRVYLDQKAREKTISELEKDLRKYCR